MPGIDEIARQLKAELPPAVLLVGDNVNLLRALAEDAARQHGATVADVIFIRKLTAAAAEAAARYARTSPYGELKVIIVALNGASNIVQASLLKALEEVPETTRFILLASAEPSAAVVSRCRVIQAAVSLPPAGETEEAAAKAAAAVRAAQTGDPALLCETLASGWDEQCVAALQRLATGVLAGVGGPVQISDWQASVMLGVLCDYPSARPVNVAVAALSLAFLEER